MIFSWEASVTIINFNSIFITLFYYSQFHHLKFIHSTVLIAHQILCMSKPAITVNKLSISNQFMQLKLLPPPKILIQPLLNSLVWKMFQQLNKLRNSENQFPDTVVLTEESKLIMYSVWPMLKLDVWLVKVRIKLMEKEKRLLEKQANGFQSIKELRGNERDEYFSLHVFTRIIKH